MFLMNRERVDHARKLAREVPSFTVSSLASPHFALFLPHSSADIQTSVLNRESKQQAEIRWRIVGLLTVIIGDGCIDNAAPPPSPIPRVSRVYSAVFITYRAIWALLSGAMTLSRSMRDKITNDFVDDKLEFVFIIRYSLFKPMIKNL